MPPFLNGLLFGLIFLIALGPAFFALIQTSIQQGFRKAVLMAVGISISDSLYVMAILFGLVKFMETDGFRLWMGVFGTIMLLAYSVYSWFKSPEIKEVEISNDVSIVRYLVKGFVLNGLNPFIIVSWATWIGTIALNFEYEFAEQVQFFVGMLAAILSSDILKAFIADKLKNRITKRFLQLMNRLVAIVIFLFAIRVIFFLIENFA